jgi:hypothetical protein
MTDLFLKAKHWQIFLLLFVLPIFFQFILMGTMMSGIIIGREPDPATVFQFFRYFPVLMIIYMVFHFGWQWSIAIGLQKKVPAEVSMKVNKFKIFFFIPLVYILLFTSFISYTVSGFMFSDPEPNIAFFGAFFIIFPLHLFAMFSIFYVIYFVAKTYKTVELQRAVKFSDFAGEFFLVWFYPVGVWIIQPKINKMIEVSQQEQLKPHA